MNAGPHAHELVIRRSKTGSEKTVVISYGDQEYWLYAFFWRRPRRRRVLRRSASIIKRHDRQSLKAGRRERDWAEIITIQQAVNQKITYQDGMTKVYSGFVAREQPNIKGIDAWASEVFLPRRD